MIKRVVLHLGHGSLQLGFPAVMALLWEGDNPHPMKFEGALPAAPELSRLYKTWQLLYRAMHHRLNWSSRIEIEATDITNVSDVEFTDLCQGMAHHINAWLNTDDFRSIDRPLRAHLNPQDDICFVFEAVDVLLQRLPWHLWNFFDTYPYAEATLSLSSYQRVSKIAVQDQDGPIRILVILGNAKGIDVERDRAYLSQLAGSADIRVCVEPSLETLTHELWQRCDILFFAGHSSSQDQGELQLNADQRLSLAELKYALRGAIARGLKLAIFNSCDGLGLARSLADLGIPQVIVMREPVPDPVAQAYLKHFLAAFSQGESLPRSVRMAREKLQGLEADYPCASWLPVIYQNPAEALTLWTQWQTDLVTQPPFKDGAHSGAKSAVRYSWYRPLLTVGLSSLLVTGLIYGVRYLGWLQRWELQAFDHLMRLRPEEAPDSRLLVVTVTEEDFQLPEQAQRQGSLSDLALERLLQKLEALQPQAIGLDIYRDFSVDPTRSDLATRLRDQPNLYMTCKVSDRSIDFPGIAPPSQTPVDRQGFSDIVKDPDNILRRHLIAMNPTPGSPCTTSNALSFLLALHYLFDTQGIQAEYISEHALQIGDVRVNRLQSHDGGYQTVDTRGFQTLLNYRATRSPLDIAPSITLTALLNGQIQAAQVKNKIVLIGVTAPSARDVVATPYHLPQAFNEVPGVFVQAHMISQILSAVEDQRPLLQSWPYWSDGVWVWVWAMLGGGIAWYSRSVFYTVLITGLVLGAMTVSCYVLLVWGWWVPLVPTGIALILTGGSVTIHGVLPTRTRSHD